MTINGTIIVKTIDLTSDDKRRLIREQRTAVQAERYSFEVQHRVQVRLKHVERAAEIEKSLAELEMAMDELATIEKELD